jgi:hypothetical protein
MCFAETILYVVTELGMTCHDSNKDDLIPFAV